MSGVLLTGLWEPWWDTLIPLAQELPPEATLRAVGTLVTSDCRDL